MTSVPVNETNPCDSGSVSLSGDVNQNTGTGTLNVTWNNCRTGNDTLNGAGSVRVDAFDFGFRAVTDGTFTFQRVTLTTPSVTGSVSGSIRLQVNFANSSETTTANLITLDGSGKMTMTQNFVVIDAFNTLFAPPTSFTESVRGRLFDSTHGFIDIATDQGLVFPTIGQRFPSSGRLILTGASNRHVRVIAFSSNAVTLRLDLNGDGSSEVAASLKWTDLTAAIAANLADTDGDGMHDSWEFAGLAWIPDNLQTRSGTPTTTAPATSPNTALAAIRTTVPNIHRRCRHRRRRRRRLHSRLRFRRRPTRRRRPCPRRRRSDRRQLRFRRGLSMSLAAWISSTTLSVSASMQR